MPMFERADAKIHYEVYGSGFPVPTTLFRANNDGGFGPVLVISPPNVDSWPGAFVQHAGLEQQARRPVRPEAMSVAQAVTRLEHDDLHRSATDAIFTDDAEVVIAGQRLLLLRR